MFYVSFIIISSSVIKKHLIISLARGVEILGREPVRLSLGMGQFATIFSPPFLLHLYGPWSAGTGLVGEL